MTSEWKIGEQCFADRIAYRIYRLKDANAPDRPKNREYYDDVLYNDKASLQAIVNGLNASQKEES